MIRRSKKSDVKDDLKDQVKNHSKKKKDKIEQVYKGSDQ